MEENDITCSEKKRKLTCESTWEQIIDLETKQWKNLLLLNYNTKIECIYNPLEYAKEPHVNFVKTYCDGEKKVLLLGMNPGPWGMCQTGVPFGEVNHVKNWLNINGIVGHPFKEHKQRPIHGFECTRSEVSGDRMWSLLKELSGKPKTLFENVFIHNYCPLAFLSKTGKNITPVELPAKERKSLEEICDKSLVQVIELLKVKFLICIGNYVSQRSQKALERFGVTGVQISTLMHPSPINPKANKGWKHIAIKQLQEANVLEYFDRSTENDSNNGDGEGSKGSSYDESWMKVAFDEAQEALSKGEVPIGCVIVYNNEIIASGRNTVNETKNATRHAEINALDTVFEYCKKRNLANEDLLKDCSLYVTVEPCIMCIEALGNLKLGKLIYGCSNDRFGGCGSVVNRHLEYKIMEIIKDFQKEKAIELLKNFYQGENPNAPTCKRKTK